MGLLDWPADVPVTHIGKPHYAASDRCWRVEVNKKNRRTCGRTMQEAWRNWHAFMQRIGKPKPNPKSNKWSWNARTQKWDFSLRQKLSRHLNRDRSRLKKLYENIDSERQTIYKRLLKGKLRANSSLIAFEKEIAARREKKKQEYKNLPTFSRIVRGFHLSSLTDNELKQIVFRQAIGPMKYHKPSNSWFCQIGKHQPKLIKLGESGQSAKQVWLILKHCLRGATDVLVSVAQHDRDSMSELCQKV